MDQDKVEVFLNMEKRRKQGTYGTHLAVILLPLAMIIGLVALGFYLWGEYRDTLMENQKEQLLITSQVLGKTLGISMMDYEDDLELLSRIGQEGTDRFYQEYLETQGSFEADLFWENEEGGMIRSINGTNLGNPVFFSQVDEQNSIWQYEDESGKKYLVLKRTEEDGTAISLVIDGEAYYQELISDIHVGTNGYVMIKNSTGRIIMHPQPEQWGIEAVEGRRQMYPELDYTSLEEMLEEQLSGDSGLSEYYSYWWTHEDLPRVKKVSAYAPAKIGGDFWVVSAVIDYDDLYEPIAEGFQSLTLTFGISLILFGALAVYIGKLLFDRRKAASEIDYLRELNQVLEEVHRSEETIAHQQRLQIMGTMTGGIAHEFNNFLTPIMGHAELLMMELPEESEEYESAQEIFEASEKAKDVIRQISSMSRKNVETVYKSISCKKLLARAVKMVESVCPANIHLEKKISQDEQYILGNTTQLNQVILNICVNAIHAIGRKEGNLTICGECVEKSTLMQYISSEPADVWETYLKIEIQDDGCGMDKETLKQIFEPFFTTKKAGEGTGLGLALAEQIISSHKGYICAESEPGEGTVFRIFLPVIDMTKPQGQETVRNDFRFVLVDDNAKILQMLCKNLEKFKISVAVCMNKKELEKCLQKQEMDVLLIDESLEGGSGIDCCMALQGRHPDLIKILMVDRVTREVVEAKQRKIINTYIEKPVSDQTIMEAVHRCIQETDPL